LDADNGVETLRQVSSSGSRVVQHHPSLNTYTLSVSTEPGGASPNLQADILALRSLIICHCQGNVSQVSFFQMLANLPFLFSLSVFSALLPVFDCDEHLQNYSA